MQIVIDSNVLIAAVIRDSAVRKLILDYEGLFLIPEFAFYEIGAHKDEVMRKSHITDDGLDCLMQALLNKFEVVPGAFLLPYKAAAMDAVKNIDPDDAPFIACCLAYPGSVLWSDDAALKKQKAVKVLNTKEIVRVL